MADLTLSHLCKRFGSVAAVENLNVHVAAGQRLVILGPSGCGKSTTLRLIAGLETADAGTILLGDRDLAALAPARRGVAMVFQDAALYPHLDVRANLAFALRSQRLATAEIAARLSETAGAFEIADLLDRYPQSLSGGQRSRVALARAIIKRPDLLLLDEPLSGLDPPLRWQLHTELMQWHLRFPTTTVHVTHDQQEAMLMGDLVAVMRSGIIQQVGTPAQLYQRPENRFVAGFIGSPGMNFASGQLVGGVLHLDHLRLKRPHGCGITDGPVDIGARPESIRLLPGDGTAGESGLLTIPAVVQALRPNDGQWIVGVNWSGKLWWVTAQNAAFAVGESVRMRIDPKSLHCFPATTPPSACAVAAKA